MSPGQIENEENEAGLSLEYDLENILVNNLGQIERGLRIYRNESVLGQQFEAGDAGRIDLLTIDENGDFVVIELKAGEVDRQVCGQIQAYMGWIKEHLAKDKSVRGVIIGNDFTPRARYAAKVVPLLTLKQYQVSFKVIEV